MRGLALAAALALVLLATPAVAQLGFPDGVNERMEVMQSLYNQIMFVGILVFLVVFVVLGVILVRFRRGGKGKRTNEAHRGNAAAELAWTIVPALILAWVGFISYQGMLVVDFDEPEEAFELQVTGFQWFWKADYGDGVAVSAQPGPLGEVDETEPFRIPADTPVIVNLTAGDVIHALWIPDLGVKVDAVPGRANFVYFEAPAGEYWSQCAEFCGLAHSYMRARFVALPQDEFDAWLREAKAAGAGGTTVEVTVSGDGISPDPLEGVGGTALNLKITSELGEDATATLGESSAEVPAGGVGWLNVTLEAGEHELSVGEATATVQLVEAEVIEVELDDFSITPDTYELEAGKTYLFQVANVGQAPHNFFVGDYAAKTTVLESDTIEGGEVTSVVFTPEESGTFDVWCNIPGHYQLGMQGTLTVA